LYLVKHRVTFTVIFTVSTYLHAVNVMKVTRDVGPHFGMISLVLIVCC